MWKINSAIARIFQKGGGGGGEESHFVTPRVLDCHANIHASCFTKSDIFFRWAVSVCVGGGGGGRRQAYKIAA